MTDFSINGPTLWLEHKIRSALRLAPLHPRFSLYEGSPAMKPDGAVGDFEGNFYNHEGRLAQKWTHYLQVYDHHLSPYRDRPVDDTGVSLRLVEVGVSHGGSLELYRKYFGPNASIVGIDIDPACANRADPPTRVYIGSQADRDLLNRVVDETGAPDIVIDDGSHVGQHQKVTFETLWPKLKFGGVYIIEDLHTSYWPAFAGGPRRKGTAIESIVKPLMDDLHGWYHPRRKRIAPREELGAIHVYDSVVIIEKKATSTPVHVRIGQAQA